MYRKRCQILMAINLLLWICCVGLYLPRALSLLGVNAGWMDFAEKIFGSNLENIMICFGIFLLVWTIAINLVSILSQANMPKVVFKLLTVCALELPLVYVLALKYDGVMSFWIDHVAPNVKLITYIILCACWGIFGLGMILNFIKRNRADFYYILQALASCVLSTLLIASNGWCGWSVPYAKLQGVLIGLYVIYLPISYVALNLCARRHG